MENGTEIVKDAAADDRNLMSELAEDGDVNDVGKSGELVNEARGSEEVEVFEEAEMEQESFYTPHHKASSSIELVFDEAENGEGENLLDKFDEEVVVDEGIGVADVGEERVAEDGQEEMVQEQNENGKHEHVENGEAVNNGVEDEEQIPRQEEAQQVINVPDKPSNGHVRDVEKPRPSVTENGIKAKTYASVVKDGVKQEPLKQSVEVREEIEKETVLVEDLGESSSSNSSSDDDENGIVSHVVPTTPPRPEVSAAPSPARPAGLGSSVPLLEHAARSLQLPHRANGTVPQRQAQPSEDPANELQRRVNGAVPQRQAQPSEDPANDDAEENNETHVKLQMIRVKFLRLAHRLGQTPHNVVVAQVLYRLGLAEQLRRNTNQPGVFSYDRASVMAGQLEAAGQEPLDFTCTIMVIGKSGVGKTATINSIFDEVKFNTDAFTSCTKKVQDVVGTVQGIKVRVIDTPGLYTSSLDQQRNVNILNSVKRFISKTPPDIVLYFDRLDMQSRDFGDVPLLRTITDIFGSSIWFNSIIVLTHAASAPPDGPNGNPLSYEMFVTQRSHVVQQAIRQASGDVRIMNPVSLVENHSACRTNRNGQRVLPNGQVWKPQLLLLSFASKILAEANTLLNLQDNPPGRPRARVPPLPFLLSSLLQSRPQLKLPEDQFADDDIVGDDSDEASDSDSGSDYDELPPFKRMNKSELAMLSKAQRKAYFEELDYREKLFFKKQLKEEKYRRKFMKKMAEAAKDLPKDLSADNAEDESSSPASVPVAMPDLALPTSFDSDNPSHRYRFLDTSNQWLVRPVLETQGWDHDVGYEGLNVERSFVVKDKIPVSVSGQLTKDKKECNFQMEVASSIKHSEAGATSLGLDMQTVGKDMAYTLRGETRVKNFRRNNTAAGVSVTLLGDAVSAGVKFEDKLVVNKRLRVLMSGGAMTGQGDVAYGGRLEATLRDKDYPIGRSLLTLALSLVDWHGDLAVGYNVQSQMPLGRGSNIIGHANLNNKGTGQIGIRLNSSEHIQIALIALLPIFRNAKRMLFDSS